MRQQAKQSSSAKPISATQKADLQKEYADLRKTWVKRKRACMDFVEDMAEGMEKKTAILCDEIGVETDKAANVILPPKL